jgi:polyisoprenoid-binding protein YceI
MKKLIGFVIASSLSISLNAQIFKVKDNGSNISFFSKSPLEDIEAHNKSSIQVLNTTTNDYQMRLTIIGFKFKNALMEEHFNENYMESTKFPNAVFKGKINEKVDYTATTEQNVTITGKMEIHGVTKDVTISGTIKKVGEDIVIHSTFKIKVAEYGIKVPSLYVKNIAEVVDVTIDSSLEPFQKK